MKYFLLILIILQPVISFSKKKNNLADSLQTAIKEAKTDSLKSYLYVDLAWAYSETNPQKALETARLAKKHGLLCSDTNLIIDGYNVIGIFNSFLGRSDSTLIYFEKALELAEQINNIKAIANGSFNIGLIYQRQGGFEDALEMFIKAGKMHDSLDNTAGKRAVLNGIGTVYKEMKVIDKALEYYQKYLTLSLETKSRRDEAFALHNIGTVYDYDKKYEKAIEYYEKSRVIKEEEGMTGSLASTYTNLGITYKALNDLNKAESYFNKGLEINEQIGNQYSLIFGYVGLGEIYAKQGKYQKSIELLEKSIEICKAGGYNFDLADSYQMIAETYYLKGQASKAYKYHKMFAQLKDSLLNSENTERMSELEAKYENEKKELKIKTLGMSNDLKQTELDKKNMQNQTLMGGLGLMLVLAFVIYRGYKRKKKTNELITIQKEQVEEQKYMLEEKNIEILDSITYAKRIQEAILPPVKIVKTWLPDSFILYLPKDIVAGDFYWMDEKDGEVLFAACDCTGHGVPGAMVSVVSHNALNRAVREFGLSDPGEILNKVNDLVEETFEQSENEIRDGMDLALCAYNPESKTIKYAGANNPLWLIRDGEMIEYKADKQAIGFIESKKPFNTKIIDTQQSDKIYLFSDGYCDQFGGEKGKKMKKNKFRKLLINIHQLDMEVQREKLLDFFHDWKSDQEQVDDVCIIGLKV